MKALDRLSNMLCDYGLAVADGDFTVARGYWAHAHQDVVRWEAALRPVGARTDSHPIIIDSWDSISDCARHGFWLVSGGAAYGNLQAVAKRPFVDEPKGVVTVEEFKGRFHA